LQRLAPSLQSVKNVPQSGNLEAAAGYFLKDNDLSIGLKSDSGTMKFQKRKEE
jgi:hypothetical protein